MTRRKKAGPKQPNPKQPASKQPVPIQPVPKQSTPKQADPKQTTPKQAVPKQPTPKQAVPKLPTPKLPTPKLPPPKLPTPKLPPPKLPASKQPASKQPASKQPVPKKPVPKQPVPKQPVPKQPALSDPKQPAPKQPAPKQPAPNQPASKRQAPGLTSKTLPQTKPDTSRVQTFDPLDYMTAEELLAIDTQLALALQGVDVVLFWTGVRWAYVQKWARILKLKTLTDAMGPLMDAANPNSPKALMKKKAYSKYVKGASGRLAQYACQHCRVVVLTNPPPDIYSRRENNTYQHLEEPILKGLRGGCPVRRIDYLHPTVDGAAHITYQTWPENKTQDWAAKFGKRLVKSWKKLNWSYKSLVTTSELDLKPLRTQVLPIVSASHVQPAQPSDRQDQETVNHFSNSQKHTGAEDEDITPLQQDIDLIEEDRPYEGLDSRGHESQGRLPESRSDSRLVGTQAQSREEQEIESHGGLFKEVNCSPAPVHMIKRCRTPNPPVTVPVINIDNIMIGAEVTVDINEKRLNRDFLYLTMKGVSGLQDWWKLRWIDHG
ncbi:hypothetical protein AYL99_05559 [Fonsecaea erecta]|uniref:Uncharacterized protein n=1 Tax=Fonsecaea erecta TaxID=1367422 RepID=A0A178ZL95_9EURO|nr:hypothetical protein AYL99_05559 [Fonsecaea erecta]OAP60557.1 hypothetical protein AYL99_05559 [Fonsecaea erecta]